MSEDILERIKKSGARIERITLHVGIDTFTPVRADEIADHKMHGERVIIEEETADRISEAKVNGNRIIAIGTTTTRALESAAKSEGGIKSGNWVTNIFITPGYEFKVVDAILTNFHLPKSTLLMMVSAFANREFILRCYEEAIREKYRLFSYGDCMFIK